MTRFQRVAVLGSTGSIGDSTLDVIARHPDRLGVYALSAYSRMDKLAADEMLRFGVMPKIALLSHSNFGSRPTDSSRKMAHARKLVAERAPHLEVDGEMHADAALSESIRLQA
ncbi:1-deoxy-D-xylulose 5-phosphate reductoisomerase-like protein, partial [Bordetella bronchiseptica E012]|uniref:phosphate acyltransferase n=1 Tax=Bordetella bronchiseptica TaxID=518 RepID=UPI000460F81F